ncbi:MAG: addiction module toxin, HicA family [Planctomycetia bacterium]|nr:addiction module toxin, HicA family [Planctomycetia bacterium]
MKRQQLTRHLRRQGCALLLEGAKHSRWINLRDRTKQATVPRHTEIEDYLARLICRQLGVPSVK